MPAPAEGFHEIYDVAALRILTEDVEGCYGPPGRVHDTSGRSPAASRTTSACPSERLTSRVHTAVIGPATGRWKCRSAPAECTKVAEYGMPPLEIHRKEDQPPPAAATPNASTG